FAKKEALVRPAKQSKNGGSHIERTTEPGNALRSFDNRRSCDQERDFVGMDRNILAAIDARAVICDDDKNRVRIAGLFARSGEELAERIIRILDGIVSFSLSGILRDSSARIGIGLVV